MVKKIFPVILILVFAALVFAYSEDPTVYITKTGSKYHTATCNYLKSSKIPISLSEASKRGYTPCSRCNAPTLSSGPLQSSSINSQGIYRVNVANWTSYKDADISKMVQAEVVKHVDGDTVHVEITNPPEGIQPYEKIRMIGIDTPETVHPNKQVEYFGKESSNLTKSRLLNKTVYLAFDWNLRDKYNRLLAYIYLPDGSCHNADIIRDGYGHAYTRFPFQFLEEFRALERYARENKQGLWE